MHQPPEIGIVRVDHGTFPSVAALNRKIAPGGPLLLATLDIHWEEPDPVSAVMRLEKMLQEFSPSFAWHECRGPHLYHVFVDRTDRTSRRLASSRRGGIRGFQATFDGRLALAHLVEHAVIDFQCTVTGERRCSGITGAHRDCPGRYDLLIECRDFSVGRCCLALSVVWITEAAVGEGLGPEERRILAAAATAFRTSPGPLTATQIARSLGVGETAAQRALEALRQVGFLTESVSTMNLSGVSEYYVLGVSSPKIGEP